MKVRKRYNLITTGVILFSFALLVGCSDEIKDRDTSFEQNCTMPIELSSSKIEFDHQADTKTIQVKKVDNFLLEPYIKVDEEYFYSDELYPDKVFFDTYPSVRSDNSFQIGEIIEIIGEWFTITKESENSILIDVQKNETSESRSLTTTISFEGCFQTLEIIQQGISTENSNLTD